MKTIDANALTTWIKESQKMTSKVKAILCYIETMPSQNRPTGKWVGVERLEDRTGYKWYRCSECGMLVKSVVNYCPKCGSYNGGESDD